jgi:hypothetical protein
MDENEEIKLGTEKETKDSLWMETKKYKMKGIKRKKERTVEDSSANFFIPKSLSLFL